MRAGNVLVQRIVQHALPVRDASTVRRTVAPAGSAHRKVRRVILAHLLQPKSRILGAYALIWFGYHYNSGVIKKHYNDLLGVDMVDKFFEMSSPCDLLGKAIRDYEKMQKNISTDTIFNFFVTTYHVMDYVKALGTVNTLAIKQFYNDTDFKLCNFLCNKGKHFHLKNREPYETKHQPAIQGDTLGSFVLGVGCLGGTERFVLLDNNQEIDVIELGEKLIDKWKAFFKTHGIS